MHILKYMFSCGLVFASTLLGIVSGQSGDKILLKVGQPVSNIEFPAILNSQIEKGDISQFQGKLLIMETWSLSCSPCLRNMPKLISLQKTFGEKVQVLLVTPDDLSTVRSFYQRRTDLRLPTAVGPELYKTFEARFGVPTLSTYVWLNQNGSLMAVTDGDEVNEENVSSILAGEKISLRPSALAQTERGTSENDPTLDRRDSFIYQSRLSGADTGKGSSASRRPLRAKAGGLRLEFVNISILSLLQAAGAEGTLYGAFGGFPPSRTVIETSATGLTRLQKANASDYFCYELVVPERLRSEIYKMMRSDLERLFGYTVHVESRKTKVLSLIKHGAGPRPSSEERGSFAPDFFNAWNSDLVTLAWELEGQLSRPVIDDTGLKFKIDLSWQNVPRKNLSGIKSELQKNGLDLREVERFIDVLVVRNVSTPTQSRP